MTRKLFAALIVGALAVGLSGCFSLTVRTEKVIREEPAECCPPRDKDSPPIQMAPTETQSQDAVPTST